MADANLFARFAQPVRSVNDYLDQYDQQDARRENLNAQRQQNALQAATMRRQGEADARAADERNAFEQLARQYGTDRKAFIGALESSGRPGFMTQAQALRKGDLDAANTQSQIDGRASENAKRQAEIEKQRREAAATQIASLNSPDEALTLLKAKVDAKEVPPELAPAFESLIRTDPKWQIKLALAVGDPAKLVETLKPHIQTNNVGGQTVTQAIDPLTGKPTITGTIENTQTKDSIASNARIAAEAEKNRQQSERQFQQRRKDDAERSAAAGGAGSAAPKPAGQPTESERTAGFLLQRIRDSQRQLASATGESPDAAKPGLLQEGIRKVSEPAANAMTGENRQRVEAAQLDILDAALTLGTGAAYTREQLEGYRKSYFPQIGDKPANVKEKADRLNNLIRAAETKAGRSAADTAPPKPVAAGGAARVNSDADYNALPSGTTFIGPDGKTRRKP